MQEKQKKEKIGSFIKDGVSRREMERNSDAGRAMQAIGIGMVDDYRMDCYCKLGEKKRKKECATKFLTNKNEKCAHLSRMRASSARVNAMASGGGWGMAREPSMNRRTYKMY